MREADNFIRLYNELSDLLRSSTDSSTAVPFSRLLDIACEHNLTIRRSKQFLRKMGDLRNAIVHDRQYPERIIADPRPEISEQFQKVVAMIKSPVKVFPRFRQNIMVFAAKDRLDAVLAQMHENDYSQVVVEIDKKYGILSSGGIVRWLSSNRQIGLADIEGAIVEDVAKHEDPTGYRYMAFNETIDAATLAFEHALSEGIPRLHAILITNGGKPTEQPHGIITPWDLLGIVGKNDLA